MIKWTLAALAAVSTLAISGAANASIVTLSIHGTFDSIIDLPSGSNKLEDLVGTPYSMSLSFGTDSALLIRSEIDVSHTPPEHAGWFFDTHSSLTTVKGGYAAPFSHGGVVADLQNDFVYDGSMGILPAGTYDVFQLTGWLRGAGPVVDPVACPHPTGGSLLGDSVPGPCSLKGGNVAVDLTLIGTSGFINTLSGIPLGGLDYGQVVYGMAGFRTFLDGAEVGAVQQDPPLSFHDGVLSGPGMSLSITVTSVPEPATWAMMLLGFGGLGAALRRRRMALAA